MVRCRLTRLPLLPPAVAEGVAPLYVGGCGGGCGCDWGGGAWITLLGPYQLIDTTYQYHVQIELSLGGHFPASYPYLWSCDGSCTLLLSASADTAASAADVELGREMGSAALVCCRPCDPSSMTGEAMRDESRSRGCKVKVGIGVVACEGSGGWPPLFVPCRSQVFRQLIKIA